VKNGKKLLSFNFKTFVKTIGLDYNKVNQPHTDVVKTELLKLGLDNDKYKAKEESPWRKQILYRSVEFKSTDDCLQFPHKDEE
ncbi:hypothetical protein Tco_1168562, partial [Tanacetum coccineum]